MKKQMRLLIVGVTVIVVVIAYLVLAGRRTQCDTIFEQTATRVGGNIEVIKNKGEFFLGREQVQALTDSSQKVGLHLKSCCLSQQTGNMTPGQFQNCVNGAKDYETKILQVTNLINEARSAKDQGNTQLAEQKSVQAREVVSAATSSGSELGKVAANLSTVRPPSSTRTATGGKLGVEQEPNNTILQANVAEMGTTISAEIAPADDTDFFQFQYKDAKNRRDIVALHLENQSPTLQPAVRLYNEDKSVAQEWRSANAEGANLDFSFSVEPGKIYYVQVASSYGRTTGRYALSVVPQRAYDPYEPNDDAFTATPIKLGQALEANIMDGADVDWYRLSGVNAKTVTVHLENQSNTLQPAIRVHNADKSVAQEWASANAEGANLESSFTAEPGKDYYLVVTSYYGRTAGKYKLSTH